MQKKSNIIQFPSSQGQIFRFLVEIWSGPVTDTFLDRNLEPPCRVIDVHSTNTLDDLHWAIFKAFDREDAHCYQFELGGKKPMDRKATIYGINECSDALEPGRDACTCQIGTLSLSLNQSMFYWFDFGDDWWHQVTLLAVEATGTKKGKYPRIVERMGESPPQYADWDEDADYCETQTPLISATQIVEAVQQMRKSSILDLIANFCHASLDEEHGKTCLVLFEEAWKTGLMLDRSKGASWAAGIVHAAAIINFLYDPSMIPHIKIESIAQHFGVAKSTMSNKGNAILEELRAMPLDPRYCVDALLKDNPLVQMMKKGMFGKGAKRKM